MDVFVMMFLAFLGWVLLAVLLADFLTGLVHWVEQAYGLATWPIIGKHVIAHNIAHHENPQAIRGGTFWGRNYQPFLFAGVLLASLTLLCGFSPFCALVLIAASLGNEVHYWNHGAPKDNPALVNYLHDAGLIQCRRQHANHHTSPTTYYCALVNFNNAWMERVDFWAYCEAGVDLVLDVKPNRHLNN